MIQAMTDPKVRPLVSHITTKQARSYTCAQLGGHPDAGGTIVRSAEYKPEAFLSAR